MCGEGDCRPFPNSFVRTSPSPVDELCTVHTSISSSILYSSLHTMHYCIACLCLKESKDSPSFTYLTLTNPLTYYYAQPEQSCLAGQPSKESKESKESKKSRRSSSPISSGKTIQNEAKPNHIPTETMRIRSTSRAVQGPSDT